MGFTLYLSGCALPAIGVLRALEERDLLPDTLICRAGGALTGGLYACGWRAAPLEHLARTLERSSLALLGQLLPALGSGGLRLGPRALAEQLMRDLPWPELPCELARRPDGLDGLLSELTDGAGLRGLRPRLVLPVRVYRADGGFEVDAITSAAHARFALTLATALRCAAFPAGMTLSPCVGGHAPAACRAEDLAGGLPQLGRGQPLVCVARAGERPLPGESLRITPPGDGGAARQAASGYGLMRAHMSELMGLC